MADDKKYRREIEEILERVNEDLPASSGRKTRAARRPPEPRAPSAPTGGGGDLSTLFTPGRLLIGGVILMLVALVAGSQISFWLGLGAIVWAYFIFFTKPRSPVEKRWRGESIEDPPGDNPANRIWRWINRN